MNKILIIGGDGLIGKSLMTLFAYNCMQVISTSRSSDNGGIIFDLDSDDLTDVLNFSASIVFICAAKTDFIFCENFPEKTHCTNVSQTLKLIKKLVENGSFVVWLSSSAVFDGKTPHIHEFSNFSPTTNYGLQKMEVELAIRSNPQLTPHVAIVRLSKVVSNTKGIASDFILRLQAGQSIDAFSDLYLSPVSLAYVCKGLQLVGLSRLPGVYHLSGESELSYLQLAQKLADRIGVPRELINSIDSKRKPQLPILYRPKHPSLKMINTTRHLDLHPEKIELTLNELFKF